MDWFYNYLKFADELEYFRITIIQKIVSFQIISDQFFLIKFNNKESRNYIIVKIYRKWMEKDSRVTLGVRLIKRKNLQY